MNKIIIDGRLTRDPKIEVGKSGIEFCKLSVAVNRRPDKSGEKKVDFFDCICFGKTSAMIEKYFKRGDGINIIGRMESEKYTDKNNQTRVSWGVTVEEVGFPLGKGRSEQAGTETPAQQEQAGTDASAQPEQSELSDVDSADLPF